MISLNYHHLYYFRTIAKAGSLSKASKTLLLAQPTLSLQLTQLEKSLRVRLFERRKQRLVLTDHGRFVLGYAERIFETGAELQEALKGKPIDGRVRFDVGILNGTPRSFGHIFLETLLELVPNAHISITERSLDPLLDSLREHRLDAILTDISIRTQDHELFDSHLVAYVPIYFAASPGLARAYPRVPQSLHGAPIVIPSSPSRLYQEILDYFAHSKVSPKIVADVQDVEIARRAALSGRGIVPLNAFTFSVSLPKGALVRLRETRQTGLYESVYMVTRKKLWSSPVINRLPGIMKEKYAVKRDR